MSVRMVGPEGWEGESLRRAARQRRGFTIIEVLIVVAIVGIILAIAIPSCVRAHDRQLVAEVRPSPERPAVAPSRFVLLDKAAVPDSRHNVAAVCDRSNGTLLYIVASPAWDSGAAIAVVPAGCVGQR